MNERAFQGTLTRYLGWTAIPAPFMATKIMSLSAQGAAQAVQNVVSIRIRIAGMVTAASALTSLKSFRPILLVETC